MDADKMNEAEMFVWWGDSWCTSQAGLPQNYMIGDIHHILMDGLPFTWRLSDVENPIYFTTMSAAIQPSD